MKKSISGFVLIMSAFFLLCGCGKPAIKEADDVSYQISGMTKTGKFSVERIELEFSGGLIQTTVRRGDALRAKAVMNIAGQGVLRASWILDNQVIDQININLHYGSVLTLFSSPILTGSLEPGRHTVRLMIHEPIVNLELPEIYFFVK